MNRLRMEFEKGPEVAFVSHLELMKLFAQAVRRGDLPLAWSEGFNPRPKINFSSGIATGMTSREECLEMELTEVIDPQDVMNRLNQTLPPGVRIHRVRKLEDNPKSLMALLQYGDYRVTVPLEEIIPARELEEQVRLFLARESVLWTIRSPKGIREKELRPGILALQARLEPQQLVLDWMLKSGSEGNIRPEHATEAFLEHSGHRAAGPLQLDKRAVYGERDGQPTKLFDL